VTCRPSAPVARRRARPFELFALGALCIAPLAAALPSPAPCRADTQRRIFERAGEAFARGDYDTAARLYEELIAQGIDDPDVTYDLGLAHARRGAHGRAIRWFERTLRLQPGADDARRGIAASQAALGARRAQRDGEAVVPARPAFREAAVASVSEDALAVAVLVLCALSFALLAVWCSSAREPVRLAAAIGAPLVAVAFVVAALGLLQKRGAFDEGEAAVVVTEDVSLREAPDPRAAHRSYVREGERVRVVARDGDWMRVHAPGGREGWALAEHEVAVIGP
jgi:tetratricopeptide (TPR) repeat protein